MLTIGDRSLNDSGCSLPQQSTGRSLIYIYLSKLISEYAKRPQFF
jgi:hypothetical protein